MSTALSGPASKLGQSMRDGVSAAINEVNRAGGVHDRLLTLIALDDGYEPARTAPNMRSLIERQDVIAVVGNVGTPTAVAAVPIANAGKTLLFGAFTGAGVLRKTPPDRYVINYRASYAEETAAMVEALVDIAGIGVEQIAFFTQRDAYGDAGFVGGITALKRYGLPNDIWVAHGRYERNTDAVENGLADIIGARTPVEAVIMVGAYEPCAQFIKLADEFDFHPIFLNVSFVGAEPLAKALGDQGDGVIVTQVVPHFDSDIPIAREYRRALERLDDRPEPNFGSFEGYVAGRILIRALSIETSAPTRESVVGALEHLGRFDIGLGQELELGPSCHQACHRVWPTVIRKGKIAPFEWEQLKSRTDTQREPDAR
ncbi:MAG: ABC transporter substrate-binding protein [Phycisphaerales bacterium]|nr:ABC transporter substrate-binding protein [Phycisphaerales bacterium]MCB9854382.1 ABC transporter substrate-binding protein [Phycisphaerales bacterium]MCB9863583.1 ABC transporter substrate-binding protein [Phycisphaerales bacterium]